MDADFYTIRLIRLAFGGASEFDGQYVVEYDPAHTVGFSPSGAWMNCLLICSPTVRGARRFQTPAAAFEYWKQSHGIREDGNPNRPLTAYTVEVTPWRFPV